jgi:alpha-1,3-rhamnosyl/mannosyltransferase
MKVRLALQQARLVVTVSEYAAREVMTVLGVARDRIRVAVEAPSEEYRPSSGAEVEVIARKYDLDGSRWFLYLGGFNPHKRVDTIIAAHAAVAAERPAAPLLVLAGDATRDPFYSEVPRLRSEIAARGTESLVRWVGYVPDADLRHLIAGAVALLLPSQAEGFGLPAIEAAACGTPVIATTASPLPELLDGGGIFHLPGDVPAIADAMASLLDDDAKRRAMGERALAMARRLSWEATAKAVLEALSSAVG